eukprot:g13520.t1
MMSRTLSRSVVDENRCHNINMTAVDVLVAVIGKTVVKWMMSLTCCWTRTEKESEPSSATSSSNYMGKIEPVSFEPVSDSVRAIVAEKVFQLVIDKYPDDRDGDVGCTFQKSKCRLYSANVMDICNTNVLLRPALLVKKMTRHGYFENALRRILPSYQQSLEWGKEIYISAVNDIRRDLDEMFFQMKAARSLVLELIITEPMLAGTGGWNGLYQHGE